jgi:hypothetical protein
MSDELKPQSIDTPEFADLMQKWALSPSCDLVQKRYDALIAHIDAWRVPAGYKLVPVKLTDDMAVAFAEQWYSKIRCIDDCQMDDCYAAMLEVAPKPEDACGS